MGAVTLITGAHLCRNPRVVKEASALVRAGNEVTVLGPVLDGSLVPVDTELARTGAFSWETPIDLSSGGVTATRYRLVRRAYVEGQRRLGMDFPGALGYGLGRMLSRARALNADYYIGHQEVGAWVVWKLMQRGRRVGADLEDWYSRDLLPEARAARPIKLLDRIERDLVQNALHCTTTSVAMADAMKLAYGRRPGVVYNAFQWADRQQIDGVRQDRLDDERPSLFWFSQTIGPGRGLEILVDALRYISKPVQLHLRGYLVPGFERTLLDRLGEHTPHAIRFHPLVSPSELLSRIAEHDIGLALEECEPPSRDLTITNKILQYLQGGLAVVATPTAGQREASGKAGDAIILAESDPIALADGIAKLVGSSERLQHAKRLSLEAARAVFSWEAQEKVLLQEVSFALDTVSSA